MEFRDDGLVRFAAEGALALPADGIEGFVAHDGARVRYVSFGAGEAVILLHGGMGNAGNWGFQVPAVVASGRRAIVIDSRGHGRSTRDARPFSYEIMAGDVFAVMDALKVRRAAILGWSDGACTGLAMAKRIPERVAGVLFFACNVDATGTKPFEMTEAIGRCLERHKADYAALSPTPERFEQLMADLGVMQGSQPNYSAADLMAITVPVTVVQAEFDEFIRPEHAAYLARTIPGATLVELSGVSHFAPVQRPDVFNTAMLGWLAGLSAG